jgi:hypothetical protein
MSVIDAFLFAASTQMAFTFIPIFTSSGFTSPIKCRKPALLVSSISITAGMIGVLIRVVSAVMYDMENVLTVPVSGSLTQVPVRLKHHSQNIRGGTTTRPQWSQRVPTISPDLRPSRNLPIAMPVAYSYFAFGR